MASSSGTRHKNREDYRRAMELEEARKAGLAPAALDEDGKEINPHIPQFMTTAPWYMQSDGPTLKHQRSWKKEVRESEKAKEKAAGTKEWYERGKKTFQATKYRKGACKNCGAMTHKTKDCMERPRARGARWTNKDIAADEHVAEVKLGYDGKRDRWNGYDARDFSKVQQRYEKIESLKQEEAKKKELEEKFSKGKAEAEAEAEAGAGEGEGDFLLKDEEEAGFSKVEKRVRTTAGGATGSVRNLRIREDTAKYLFNLDVNSAHYDPKSRSMRADPNPDLPDSEKKFRGDAHLLKEGEVQAWNRLVLHSQLGSTSQESHMQALPSQAEALYKEFKAKKEKVVAKSKTNIEDVYGNAASKAKVDQRLLRGQTERYVEYNRRGQVVKGEEAKVTSRYEEDVFVNNHKSVWGSWWQDGVWGYACCRQTLKNSYCTGLAERNDGNHGLQARAEASAVAGGPEEAGGDGRKMLQAKGKRAASGGGGGFQGKTAIWGGGQEKGVELDQEKLRRALEKESERVASKVESDDRKRGYNSLRGESGLDMTPEEMEAYRMKKMRPDDPMLSFSKDHPDAV
ncbi:pre-mRNA-processing factor SLU7 [Chloropicon primus]|uniref:Pre-mRNA-splicing factor SLU7 n=2 Tax=Chloropicon primus TaxID=1764295 RepID=A0A5B8MKR9_9CHLO|nr:pre-mRNA-processing factor SLU7 [Chloropicon primus]|eukprot:QDZ21066.1 pre-mRNA-processing factor SLU7 [Chloropicon primus]